MKTLSLDPRALSGNLPSPVFVRPHYDEFGFVAFPGSKEAMMLKKQKQKQSEHRLNRSSGNASRTLFGQAGSPSLFAKWQQELLHNPNLKFTHGQPSAPLLNNACASSDKGSGDRASPDADSGRLHRAARLRVGRNQRLPRSQGGGFAQLLCRP